MEYVRKRGYPAPEVFDVSEDGRDLVMERIDGPTMLALGSSRPWLVRRLARELAELHIALHRLPAPGWVTASPCGPGDRLLHLDLHPLNILVSPNGPVVIDWTNAASGDPSTDVAMTWALVAAGSVPSRRVEAAVIGLGRKVLLHAFLEPFDRQALAAALGPVVAWKCTDPNMTPGEVARMRALAAAHSG